MVDQPIRPILDVTYHPTIVYSFPDTRAREKTIERSHQHFLSKRDKSCLGTSGLLEHLVGRPARLRQARQVMLGDFWVPETVERALVRHEAFGELDNDNATEIFL